MKHPFSQYSRVHFVGIKGVGMTALALCFQDLGLTVTGSDTDQPQITDPTLKSHQIHPLPFSPANIHSRLDLIIHSAAYSKDQHPELIKAASLQLPLVNQATALAQLANTKTLIAVCGVGGKTTTTSMLIWIFTQLGLNPSWAVGVSGVGSLPPGKFTSGKHFILEADEYAIAPPHDTRPKLALYKPQVVICTNINYDHPDIYSTYQDTATVFTNFFSTIPSSGLLIINHQTKNLTSLLSSLASPFTTFGTSNQAEWSLHTSSSQPPSFTLHHQHTSHPLHLPLPGTANALNASAAIIAAHHFHTSPRQALAELTHFPGIKRRLETIKNQDHILYLDDYAHHPTEIASTLTALKHHYPKRRLLVAFQPHTYSRTQALLPEFSTCFTAADQVFIVPIFASAREPKSSAISSNTLASSIKKHHPAVSYFSSFSDLSRHLNHIKQPHDIILTLGAGDIYQLHQQL